MRLLGENTYPMLNKDLWTMMPTFILLLHMSPLWLRPKFQPIVLTRSISVIFARARCQLLLWMNERMTQCPKGTYREGEKGRGVQDCDLCPVNTYQNVTAATAKIDCIRCPDGLYAELEGTAECSCITADSCIPEWQNYQRNSVPFVGRM